jgi:hypothetical protein
MVGSPGKRTDRVPLRSNPGRCLVRFSCEETHHLLAATRRTARSGLATSALTDDQLRSVQAVDGGCGRGTAAQTSPVRASWETMRGCDRTASLLPSTESASATSPSTARPAARMRLKACASPSGVRASTWIRRRDFDTAGPSARSRPTSPALPRNNRGRVQHLVTAPHKGRKPARGRRLPAEWHRSR